MKRRIVVLGAGLSGLGAAILAKKKGFNVFVSDLKRISDETKTFLLENEIDWEEEHTLKNILKLNLFCCYWIYFANNRMIYLHTSYLSQAPQAVPV